MARTPSSCGGVPHADDLGVHTSRVLRSASGCGRCRGDRRGGSSAPRPPGSWQDGAQRSRSSKRGGSQASSRAATGGWVRQQGRDRYELPIMMESNRIWRGSRRGDRGRRTSRSPPPAACIWRRTSGSLPSSRSGTNSHESISSTRECSRRRRRARRFPAWEGRWNRGGMLTPSDGRGEPFVAVPALARAVHRLGVSITENCAVRTVESAAGRVRGVQTEHGQVRADRVVLASGAWSTYFASNAGIDLPQLVVRSTAGRTHAAPDRGLPNVSAPGFTLRRREDGGYTVSSGDIAEHYVCPRSFKYFTKFFSLLRLSARDLRIRLKPPAGYPGAWGFEVALVRRRGHAVRTDAGGQSATVGGGPAAPRRTAAAPGALAARGRYRGNLGGDDRRDARRGALHLRGAGAPGSVHRHRHERTRIRDRARAWDGF